jgi:hypothetical protein
MTKNLDPVQQLLSLDSDIDRLWWLAQMEVGITSADIDREPKYGPSPVLELIASKQERSRPNPLWMFATDGY